MVHFLCVRWRSKYFKRRTGHPEVKAQIPKLQGALHPIILKLHARSPHDMCLPRTRSARQKRILPQGSKDLQGPWGLGFRIWGRRLGLRSGGSRSLRVEALGRRQICSHTWRERAGPTQASAAQSQQQLSPRPHKTQYTCRLGARQKFSENRDYHVLLAFWIQAIISNPQLDPHPQKPRDPVWEDCTGLENCQYHGSLFVYIIDIAR